MNVQPRTIRNYVTPNGKNLFREWRLSLKDKKTLAIVLERVRRLREGNFGEHRRLTSDLYELKIRYGAGYRVYFGVLDDVNIIILCGGTKRTQAKDIEAAKQYWEEFKQRQ